ALLFIIFISRLLCGSAHSVSSQTERPVRAGVGQAQSRLPQAAVHSEDPAGPVEGAGGSWRCRRPVSGPSRAAAAERCPGRSAATHAAAARAGAGAAVQQQDAATGKEGGKREAPAAGAEFGGPAAPAGGAAAAFPGSGAFC